MGTHVDLNLLTPLAALLEHRSVTAAARSLQMGQPAMSAALARLRRTYSDELLVRVGQHYELTPLASGLRETVSMALELATSALSNAPGPDPTSLHRAFSVGLSEYELLILGGRILALVRAEAPAVKVNFDVISPDRFATISDELRHHDCMVVQSNWLTGYPNVRLFNDTLCIAASSQNDTLPEVVGPDDLAELNWCTLSEVPVMLAMGQRMLTLPAMGDHIASTTASLVGQLATIAGTDLVSPAPCRLVDLLGSVLGVRALECKLPTEHIAAHLVWHPARERDRALTWFLDLVQRAARGIDDT